jgi:hypothetical protein
MMGMRGKEDRWIPNILFKYNPAGKQIQGDQRNDRKDQFLI